jgi:hypothetical protein
MAVLNFKETEIEKEREVLMHKNTVFSAYLWTHKYRQRPATLIIFKKLASGKMHK